MEKEKIEINSQINSYLIGRFKESISKIYDILPTIEDEKKTSIFTILDSLRKELVPVLKKDISINPIEPLYTATEVIRFGKLVYGIPDPEAVNGSEGITLLFKILFISNVTGKPNDNEQFLKEIEQHCKATDKYNAYLKKRNKLDSLLALRSDF